MASKKLPKPVEAWAWAFGSTMGDGEVVLCCWAYPQRDDWRLIESRPTTDAKIVRVRIVPVKPKKRRAKR